MLCCENDWDGDKVDSVSPSLFVSSRRDRPPARILFRLQRLDWTTMQAVRTVLGRQAALLLCSRVNRLSAKGHWQRPHLFFAPLWLSTASSHQILFLYTADDVTKGPLQQKFNPVQRRSQKFSWWRVFCHLLLLAIILALFVVFLVYSLVERDVTTKQEKPRKAGFSISDDGDLHACQCDVSSYSLTTLLGTLEVDLSILQDFNVCEVSAADCVNAAFDCQLGITPGGCDVPAGASCDDFGVCTEEMGERCKNGLTNCMLATMVYILVDDDSEALLAEYFADQLEEYPPEIFDQLPSCELECITELLFGLNFCSDFQKPVGEECAERYLAHLESDDFFQTVLNVTDGPPGQDIAAAFCDNTGTVAQCFFGVAYPAYGQCTRHACNSTRHCTALERVALLGELVTKMNTFLGSALVNVPQYYGSEKETIKSIERFFDQTLDFWAEFVLQQGQEFLDSTVTLCVDGRGLCSTLQEIYSPLHSVRKDDLKAVLREILLTEVERNKEEIYERYLDLCGDVTCVVFQEKSAFSVFVSSLGAAGGNMGTVFLILALFYAPIYTFTSNRSKVAKNSAEVSQDNDIPAA